MMSERYKEKAFAKMRVAATVAAWQGSHAMRSITINYDKLWFLHKI